MRRPRPRSVLPLLVSMAALAAACGGELETPEARARAVVERLVAAANHRDLGDTLALISDAYADDAGNDKQALKGIIARYYLSNEAIHVFTRVRGVSLTEPPDRAELVVLAALAAAPVTEPGALEGVDADLYRFDLEMRDEDGEWRIVRANWRPAAPGEFL